MLLTTEILVVFVNVVPLLFTISSNTVLDYELLDKMHNYNVADIL